MKKQLLFWGFVLAGLFMYAQTTTIPDDNFENYLETHAADGSVVPLGDPTSMGDGIANNDLVLTSRINTVTSLDISSQNIGDLTGIEGFTSLISLNCTSNNVTSINTNILNANLTEFRCGGNNLSSLDVTPLTSLEILSIGSNAISSLNLSQNLNLLELYCSVTQITNLDLTNNADLKTLYANFSSLETIDLSNSVALETGQLGFTQLTSIDFSNCVSLKSFNCSANDNLTSINLKNGNNVAITNFYADANNMLTCIQVDNVTDANNNVINNNWSKDSHSYFETNCNAPATTSIPDANFENYLETHTADGAVVAIGHIHSLGDGIAGNNLVLTSKVNTLVSLDISNQNIADLTGIEDFIALEELRCNNNVITALDVSQNTNLITLYAWANQLSNINVTQNINLENLAVDDNKLTSLDITQNTALKFLDYSNWDEAWPYNTITTLDVSQNVNLETISMYNVWLQNSPDLTNNTNLKYFRNDRNPNLSSIDVSNNSLLETLILSRCALTSIDVSNNVNLKQLYLSRNAITGSLDLSNHNLLEHFAVNNNDITSLNIKNGNNTALSVFYANENLSLTCIQVDNINYAYGKLAESGSQWGKDSATQYQEDCANPSTATVYVPDNNLEQALIDAGLTASAALDDYILLTEALNIQWGLDLNSKGITDPTGIESMVNLKGMNISNNNLSAINLSQNTKLEYLDVANNNLAVLNVSNNPNLNSLHCPQNNLTALDVAHLNLTQLSISENNISTINLTNSTNLTHLWANDNILTALDISTNTNLVYLNYNFNPNVGNVDFSSHTKLVWLSAENTGMTTINVTNSPDLLELNCGKNNLNSLNVSNNINLITLLCHENSGIAALNLAPNNKLTRVGAANCNIGTMDISTATDLQYLDLYNNNLTALDVTNNTKLIELNIPENNITGHLDLSNHDQLTHVSINGNDYSGFNLKNGANTNITSFWAINNPNLTCIQVDNETYATTNFTNKDTWATFSTDCNALLSVEDEWLNSTLTLYPNPTKNYINIEYPTEVQLTKIEMYNILGKRVQFLEATKQLDMSTMNSGVYFVKITTSKGSVTKKIMKE